MSMKDGNQTKKTEKPRAATATDCRPLQPTPEASEMKGRQMNCAFCKREINQSDVAQTTLDGRLMCFVCADEPEELGDEGDYDLLCAEERAFGDGADV